MDQVGIKTRETLASPRPKAGELVRRLEEDINVGALVMGSWLRQVDLEARYSCTRIDLRQALDRLVEKGLVRQVTNRGYQVETLGPGWMAEIRQVRAILEVAAAEAVMASIDAAGLEALDDAARQFEAAVVSGTMAEQESANTLFHSRMLAYCPNRELVALIFDLRRRVPLALSRQYNTNSLLLRSARDHFDFVALLRSRDSTQLADRIRQHVVPPPNGGDQ